MIESNLIIAVIVGLVVGVGIPFLLKSISKKNSVNGESAVNTDHPDLNILKSNVKTLESEKAQLQKKISENEKLLRFVQESGGKNVSFDSAKLIKENQNLKDEIEELEDDIEDLEKRNKKVVLEKNEIEEVFDIALKEKSNLLIENEELAEKLNINTTELKNNNQSLIFINNILNAKNSSGKDLEDTDLEDNDLEDTVRKTLEIYSFISSSIYDCFREYDWADDLDDYAWHWRNIELKTWIKNKKIIAIVGEFSSGKTSIVNRILSQDDPKAMLLPVSSKETTAIPTYVSKSKDFNCQFYSPDNNLRNIKKETFEMVTKSVLDKVNVSHLIKYFVLSYDNKHLENISILDTPGFGSTSGDIIKRTTEVIKEAHALFWVIDGTSGDINRTSIEVLKKHLNGMPLYFIINRIDLIGPVGLEQLEEKIKQTASVSGIEYKAIIRFSQEEKVDVIMKHIQEIESYEEPPLMSFILSELDILIKEMQDKKRELNEKRKTNSTVLNQTETSFKTTKNEIKFSSERILGLVKTKDSFWNGTQYKIDTLDYDEFVRSAENISNYSDRIINLVGFYNEDINSKIEIDNEIAYNKYQLENLQKVKKDFVKLVEDYNPNLLN